MRERNHVLVSREVIRLVRGQGRQVFVGERRAVVVRAERTMVALGGRLRIRVRIEK